MSVCVDRFRLHCNYTEDEGNPSLGVELYDNYVQACIDLQLKPQSANYVGRCVSSLFPNVQAKKCRSKTDWTKFQRRYIGLKGQETKEITIATDVSAFVQHLQPGMFLIEQSSEWILIGIKTHKVCQGYNVLFELQVFKDLRIAIKAGTKSVTLANFGIWEILPSLSVYCITALLKSVQSLKLCCGKDVELIHVEPQKGKLFTKVVWGEQGMGKMHIQSPNCMGVLSLISHSDICACCQTLFRDKGNESTPCKQVTSTNDLKLETPERDPVLVSDASVGTTPLKTVEEVLVKYFPHLKQHDKLLHNLTDQISLAHIPDPRGRRYEKDLISLAIILWTRSPQNYKELIHAGYILPSPRTLSLYKNCITQKPGINKDMFRWMSLEAERINLNQAGYIGGLLLDEMNIQKDLQIVTKGGEWKLVGLTDMGEGSQAMTAMSKKKPSLALADHALQFLFHGMTGFRMPFASYPTNQANASDLYLTVWEAVGALVDWGFTVAYISLDGSSNNRAFVKMLFPDKPLKHQMTITNRADPSSKITFIPDPSHLIKKVRNSVFSSGEGEAYTRLMVHDGKFIIWKHWEEAFEWCKNRDINPIAPHSRLSNEFIYLTDQGKMRNVYAEQTLNESMLVTMKGYQSSLPPEKAVQLDSTIEFLNNTKVLVENFRDMRPIESVSDARLQENKKVLEWFQHWESNAKKSSELMTAECREDLSWMVVGFEHFVSRMITEYQIPVPPADINSDIIENFFCSQRGIKGGSKTNPPMHSYLYNINSIVLGQPTISTKSNTGGRGKAAQPYSYSTPGPLRPKMSKRRKLEYKDAAM